MEVQGIKNLFPLHKVGASLRGYFIDAKKQVYSTRGAKIRIMAGSKPNRFNEKRYFTLNGSTYSDATLFQSARNHPEWKMEVGAPVSPEVEDSFKESAAIRDHATTLEQGLEAKGYIIAAIEGKKLAFGSEPKIHLTDSSVRSEMIRLATINPGEKFVCLKIVTSVVAGGVRWE